jgi:cystathionine beta-synthase
MHDRIYQAIGNTPLVRVKFDTPADIYAKLEYMNPGGSVKDRSALYMIEKAEKNGHLKPGGTIVEASSGNAGIAAAMIGTAKGYKVIVTTSKKISDEKLKTLKAFGAEVKVCECVDNMTDKNSYYNVGVEIAENIPNSVFLNQYMNVDNAEAHYHLTAPEIWKQTDGKITHFFAAAGSCGTISGVGKFLKEKNKDIKVIAVDSENSFYATKGNPKFTMLEGIGIDFDTPVLLKEYIDEFLFISDEDSLKLITTISKRHGIFGGLSSGSVFCGVSRYAPKLKKGDLAVMLLGDSGRAYLSKLDI